MSRYLTPSKICLVVLVELYRTSEVPTANTIAFLSFISSHIVRRSEDHPVASTISGSLFTAPSLKDFENVLSPLPSKQPGRSLYDLFLQRLWAFQSFEQLPDFLETVRQYLSIPRFKTDMRTGCWDRSSSGRGQNPMQSVQPHGPISPQVQPRTPQTTIWGCATGMGRSRTFPGTILHCLGRSQSHGGARPPCIWSRSTLVVR